jgi:hypothetical protein
MTPLLMIAAVAWVDRDIPRNVLSCTRLPAGHSSCTSMSCQQQNDTSMVWGVETGCEKDVGCKYKILLVKSA